MAKFGHKKWQSFILLLSCLLLILLWHSDRAISASKRLIVATEPAFAPMEFQASEGGLQGFDIDVMQAIGQAADLDVQFQSLPFDGIIPALQARTVDAAISSITITPERLQAISFSRPYFKAGLAIATRKTSPDYKILDDLQGKAIAVQIGTTGAETAKKIPNASIRTFDSAPLALQELQNGNVDAVINDAPVTQYAIKTGNLKGLKIISQLVTEEYYGIATAKNSPSLEAIDRGLSQILQNGTYAQIYQKWFGTQPPELPESILKPSETSAVSQNSASIILKALPLLLAGALITVGLTAIATVFGMIGGSLIGIARLSKLKPIRWATGAYVDFFRGTPLLVQIFMVYFGLPALIQELGLQFTLDRLAAAIAALSLNSAAYIAEIVRAGIQSIEPGQTEAAQSLGLDGFQTMRYVVFPQAIRRMLPPLGNEFITLLKDTSLVAVIGFEELFRRGQLIVAQNYRPFELYTAVALIYLVLTLLSSQGFSYLERRMNPARKG